MLVLIGMLLFLVPVFVEIFERPRRRAADPDEDRRHGLRTIVRASGSSSSRDRGVISASALEEDRDGPARWDLQAPPPMGSARSCSRSEWRGSRARLEPRRRRRRHHPRARDHGHDVRQHGDRGRRRHRPREGAPGRPDRPAASENPIFPPMVAHMVRSARRPASSRRCSEDRRLLRGRGGHVDPDADLDHRAADDDRRRLMVGDHHHLDVPADVQAPDADQITNY